MDFLLETMYAGEYLIGNPVLISQVLEYKEASMAKKPGQRSSKLSVYLYIPNIIGGYLVILLDIYFCFLCLLSS